MLYQNNEVIWATVQSNKDDPGDTEVNGWVGLLDSYQMEKPFLHSYYCPKTRARHNKLTEFLVQYYNSSSRLVSWFRYWVIQWKYWSVWGKEMISTNGYPLQLNCTWISKCRKYCLPIFSFQRKEYANLNTFW